MTLSNFSDKKIYIRIAVALLAISIVVIVCGREDAPLDWRQLCAARGPSVALTPIPPAPTPTILRQLRHIHENDSRLRDLDSAFKHTKSIPEMAQAYLEAGFDPNSSLNYRGSKPISKGAVSGTADLARFFIAADANNATDALHIAVIYRNLDYAQGLIDAGANVNSDGETPLHTAALYATMCRTQMLDAFINAGADINAKTSEGYTPLHYALQRNPRLRYMHWHSEESREATFETHQKLNAARLIIDAGADVDAKDNAGETALHIAAERSRDEIAIALIVAGADVNAKDNTDKTPLHIAVHSRRPDLTALLIAADADVNAKNGAGETPLHTAAERDADASAAALIAAGADIHARDNTGATPLHTAVISRSADMVEALVGAGADIHAADRKGRTPASIVAAGRNYEYTIVALTQDNNAWTPATLARRGYALAKLLKTEMGNKARALINLPRRAHQTITGLFRVESGT